MNLPSSSSHSKKSPLGMFLLSTALCLLAWSASASSTVKLSHQLSEQELEGIRQQQHRQQQNEPQQYEGTETGECHIDGSCYEHADGNLEVHHTDYHHHDGSMGAAGQHHKQQQNHTLKDRDGGLKQASKETDAEDDSTNNDLLLHWLSHKMVPDVKSCGVYLAPSTIPGAGLGMFAGRSYRPNEVVTQGDIVIPLSEIDWHNGFELAFFLWEEYTWSDSSFFRMTEENGYQSGLQGCSPGIGAAINCDLPLVNVVDTWSKIDGAGLHRRKDPGVGAFTPYHDRKSRATRAIQAGEELYIDYGENYFQTRESTYGLMPMRKDYREANSFAKRFIVLRTKALKNIASRQLKNEIEHDLWDVIVNWGFESRMLNALPRNHSDLDEVMEMGGTEWRNYKRSIRDVAYLEEHGQCMDNIKPGRSTIANAGRGAFATRFIPKGALVSPAPLIHIADKRELVMYDVLPENAHGLVHRNASRPIHHQLLLNYCFGHRNSTLLLSPYGLLTSLINHSPDKANTRIVWTSSKTRNLEWLEMHPNEFVGESHSGLQFDFIALRDIDANEEILIDYGPEWQAAWQKHVQSWKKPEGADDYIPAYDLQKRIDDDVPTEDEGGLGDHIQTYCHEHFRLLNGLGDGDDDYHRCRAIKRYKNEQGETRYLVELYYVSDSDEQSSIVVTEILFDCPRSIFHFEDSPYTRDHQMSFSFRHEMMIPDDMFPKAWMNRND